MVVCVDGTFFAFIGRSGLITWPELIRFLTLKREIGNAAFLGRRLVGTLRSKGAPYLTTENHVAWRNFLLNREISNDWLRAWWRSIKYPLSIAKFPIRKEIFLIAHLRKFHRVSNSIAESPIRKEIFIIAERGKIFQVFDRGISMPWTQKL